MEKTPCRFKSTHCSGNCENAIDSETMFIVGVNENGERIRPREWAHRIAGFVSEFRGKRLTYSACVQPTVLEDGTRVVVLDSKLQTGAPEIFEQIVGFVRQNGLTIKKCLCENPS